MTRSTFLPRLRSALAAAALCAAGAAAQASVLILGAPALGGGLADVQSKIAGTGVLSGVVDVFNVHTGTPTLAMLTAYDAVLVFSDTNLKNNPAIGGFANAVELGNVLADYVDAGGGVVEAGLSNATIPFGGLSGRFVTANYDVFDIDNRQASCGGLGAIALPGSPMLRGVDSFDGGSSALCFKLSPKAGASVVASWSNGRPLLGYRDDHNGIVASLNLFPESSDVRADLWKTSSDGALLMANTLAFAAGELPEPDSLALLGIAALAAGLAARRRTRQPQHAPHAPHAQHARRG